MKNKQLVQRLRNRKNNPNGVLVARKVSPKTFMIGWSLCNKNDAFDMETGTTLAFGRTVDNARNVPVPNSINKQIIQFHARCEKYFKGCKVTNFNVV